MGKTSKGQGTSSCWQTLASSCVANMTMRSIEILRCRAAHKDEPCASVLCPLCNIYWQPSLVLLSFLFSISKLITAGLLRLQWNTITKKSVRAKEKKKKETNNQKPLFIGIYKYIKGLFLRMFNVRIISVCLGHIAGGGAGGDTKMDTTYLKPFKVEIQIAFLFGLSGSFSMSVNFFCFVFPNSPSLVWEDFLFPCCGSHF